MLTKTKSTLYSVNTIYGSLNHYETIGAYISAIAEKNHLEKVKFDLNYDLKENDVVAMQKIDTIEIKLYYLHANILVLEDVLFIHECKLITKQVCSGVLTTISLN